MRFVKLCGMEALLAALLAPSISVHVDMGEARFCNCCTRVRSDDTMIVVRNEIKPRSNSCWQKIFCACCYNPQKIEKEDQAGKEAFEKYLESNYDVETRRQAAETSKIDLKQLKSITLRQARALKTEADQLAAQKIASRKNQLLDAFKAAEELKKGEEEEKEIAAEPLDLPVERATLCRTLKAVPFKKQISEKEINSLVNDVIVKMVRESHHTMTVQKIHLQVVEQLQKKGYVPEEPKRRPLPSFATPHHSPANSDSGK